ncbi:mucoidy inhibitor MuiA family protein [Candidatus Thorarchaeota archaeon]|nr:MAG: mucoidy inhibitor MuiA family protein [Candidatus Thorarchaeota archaeon]
MGKNLYTDHREIALTDLKTKVSKVTVLLDGALVTRTGKKKLEAGSRSIWIRGVTIDASRDSFRVTGKGPAIITNYDVVRQTRVVTGEEDVSELREKMRDLQRKLQRLDDAIQINEDRLNGVKSVLADFSETFGRTFAGGEVGVERLTEMDEASILMIKQIKEELAGLSKERKDLVDQIEVLRHEIADKSGTRLTEETFDVQVSLDVEKTSDIILNVDYQCSSASWSPQYDINLEGKSAEVRRIALVSNHTHEDWNKVDMVVSSAQARPVEAVEGRPLILREFVPMPAKRAMAGGGMRAMAKEEAPPAAKLAAAPPPPPAPEMMIEEAEVEEVEGGIARYEPPSLVTIESGQKKPVDLISEDLKSKTLHYWYPDGMVDVVAENEVTNGDSVLMAGKAKIYAHGEYIGETAIPFTSPREKRTLGTRIAHDVKAEKKLVDKTIHKAGLTKGKLKREYTYRLTIENLSKDQIEIEVVDRMPHSNEPELEVNMDINKLGVHKQELGVITWNLGIPSKEKHTIEYGYEVEWKRGRAVYPPLP